MPVRIPSGLYSAGQVSMDTTRYTNALLKDMATKKAAKEAAIKNADKLYKEVNTAGVRPQDLYGVDQNGVVLTGATASPNSITYEATQWYNDAKAGKIDKSKYMDIMNKIDRSKNRAKFELDLGKMAVEGKYAPEDDDIHVQEKISKSIYDPSSLKADGTDYNWTDIPAFIGDFDASKQKSFFDVARGKAVPTYDEPNVRYDTTTNEYIMPKKYTDSDLKNMSTVAASLIDTNKESKKYYNKMFTTDPSGTKVLKPEYADLTKEYESVYGTGQVIDTPEKAAAADAIRRFKTEGGEEIIKDQNYIYSLRKKYNLGGSGGAPGIPNYVFQEVDNGLDENIKAGRGRRARLSSIGAPITTNNLIVDEVRKAYPKAIADATVGSNKIYLEKTAKGTINIYLEKEFVGVLGQKGIDIKATTGAKNKGAVKQGTTSPLKLSSYDPAKQNAIKAHMQANNMTEQEAIQDLINEGRI